MPTAPDRLLETLQDSRQRWRGFALLDAAMLFETDAAGCLTFLVPEQAGQLGLPVADLLGSLPEAGAQRIDLPDGRVLDLVVEPLAMGGLRGRGRDATAEAREAAAAGLALRRAATLGNLLRRAGEQPGPAAARDVILARLKAALPAAGVALLVATADGWQPVAGDTPDPSLPDLRAEADGTALLTWRAGGFGTEEADLLQALLLPLAALHADAKRRAALEGAARRDALTGLLNRYAFEEGLAARLAEGGHGTLAFLDMDGLKPLNDQFGHEAGDAALRGLATRLAALVRRRDLAARLGGDEFCVWLDRLDEPEAVARLSPLGAPSPLPDWPEAGSAAYSASLGSAVAAPGEGVASLLARADAAMYAAKRARKAARAAQGRAA